MQSSTAKWRCRIMRKGATIKRLLPWIIVAGLLVAVVLFVASMFHMGTGSPRYARKWRKQLLTCQSLEEVKQHFNCIEIRGGTERTPVTEGMWFRPHALIKSFPDGRWIACAYADSHGGRRGGGTVVSRDGSGEIHMFFGHVCGDLFAEGETLEEFYASLREYCRHFRGKEVFLK